MGTGFSSFSRDIPSSSPPTKPGLGDLPESCVSSILMFLDPLEICKSAQINKAFRAASLADFVWESKLPSNYMFLVDKVLDLESLPKKELYARLCQPNGFDGGTKEAWLDKSCGQVFLVISSKALRITGIDDRRYWSHISTEESRHFGGIILENKPKYDTFHTVAYLQKFWWVEALGELEFEFPRGSYSLYFRLQLGKTCTKRFGRRVCTVDQVHGWHIKPVRFQLSTSDGQHAVSECYLHEVGSWVHYHVGDFVVNKPNMPIKINFSMIQIDCTHTKGGLCLDSVLITPSKFTEKLIKCT